MMRDVHWCVIVDYQQIENDNIANQIHGFTIDYGKFILIVYTTQVNSTFHARWLVSPEVISTTHLPAAEEKQTGFCRYVVTN